MAAVGKADVEAPAAPPCPYDVEPSELWDMNEAKDTPALKGAGGAQGLAKKLYSDLHKGLDPQGQGLASIEAHGEAYGLNQFPEVPPKSFFALVWGNFQDPVIIILCIAAAVSTALGAAIPEQRKHAEWIEGVAIWVAVFIVVSVGAGNDYQKDRQFRKLNAQRDKIMVKVVRGGHTCLVENIDLVVGDLYILDTGDKVVADGICFDSQGLVVDEASLTGESDPIRKNPDEDCWVRSGTQVTEGSGKLLVVAVGVHSEWGKTMALVGEAGDDETPLQVKLTWVASTVGKIGLAVAICCFCALLAKWCVVNKGFPIKKINTNGPVQFFLYAVTIIVVAVPEGLPLAVTIALAYSMKKMMKDNNFVRVLAACETMGGATAICSDKTGTLTENRMTVTEGWFAGKQFDHCPGPEELPQEVCDEIKLNCALNSKAFVLENGPKVDFVGNRTECALLVLLKNWGCAYESVREEYDASTFKMFGFSSAKKMASATIKFADKFRHYNKGAAEWVLKRCTSMYDGERVVEMSDADRAKLYEVVTEMAKRGLRCICLTYTDYPLVDDSRPADFFEDSDNLDRNLVCMAIVGIKDPVRKEVPEAVRVCQRAGITVRMVTGDNIHTAMHIARECGILTEDSIALEGPDFRKMAAQELLPLLHKLRVLARSSPEDKLTLVCMLKQQGDVVAVTGDGTNDAPALKESDVGLAMGIAGTEVAKEAADIIIMDDNFSSIVKAVLWGRSVFTNIRKFLMFQLTVNFVALVIAFFGAVIDGHEPLNVLQLLWVNLIMDTMGALALATEDPNPELLLMKPYGREENLITRIMWKHILVQGCYQIFWMFLILYGVPKFFTAAKFDGRYDIESRESFWARECLDKVNLETNALDDNICKIMNVCGFPYPSVDPAGSRNTNACPLYGLWNPNITVGIPIKTVPTDERQAMCDFAGGNGTCAMYNLWHTAYETTMKDEYLTHTDLEYRPALSVLFNTFIFCQVFNEINARRINDEYTIFVGLFTNPIFVGVIAITVVFQVIIINVPFVNTKFFKVEPLTWEEWLITVAIGLMTIPLSLLTRYLSKHMPDNCLRGTRVHAATGRTLSGKPRANPRSVSGSRTFSGGGRSNSNPGGSYIKVAP
ncbi:putative calcium-transporting ATPase 5, plasma membrane-type [Tetrabaena socialis]|uniref:Calcium-transporting ATPase n=1 Tax=Tetrabaena socialis TaxID=47790 RepID=A0A2J8AFK1_9CHLO|nr:putative calcium-transporting ATPase 5, plasma membrane-type [Tetrabaena socialis]|eukprot:PNH11294.1 putative calcium-transporting ATPase 5, plasma membrane-type [Tetrabaena socialis]